MALHRSGQSAATTFADPGAPVEPRDDCRVDGQGVHQVDHVDGQGGLLTVAHRIVREESGRAVASEIGHDHPVTRGSERGRGLGVAVDVVGPAVEEHDRLTVGRSDLDVSDVERTGVDLLHRPERRRVHVSRPSRSPTR